MKFVEYKLATGAMLTGYLRDETTEMPSYNTRPAVLILPGGGYRYCSPREADPVAVQFLQAGYHVFTLIYSTDHAPLLWQPLTEASSAILYLRRNAADLRWRLPPPCCGMQLPCSRPLVLPEPKPAPMRWCWGTPLSPAASLPTAALLRTCAARMKPCCRP